MQVECRLLPEWGSARVGRAMLHCNSGGRPHDLAARGLAADCQLPLGVPPNLQVPEAPQPDSMSSGDFD
jgi:hypothetical protein